MRKYNFFWCKHGQGEKERTGYWKYNELKESFKKQHFTPK